MQVSSVYEKVYSVISQAPVKDYVPYSWVSLVHVKKEHYKALSNFYVALGLLDHEGELKDKTVETLSFIHDTREGREGREEREDVTRPTIPRTSHDRKYLGKMMVTTY